MHCRACDKPFQDFEIRINEKSGTWEDLCSECLGIAFAAMRDEVEEGDDLVAAVMLSAAGEDWE